MTNTAGTEAATNPVTYVSGPPTSVASPLHKPSVPSPELSTQQFSNMISEMNPLLSDPSPPPAISSVQNFIPAQAVAPVPVSTGSSTSRSSSHRKNSDHVKRPMNAFLIWSTRRRHEIKEREPQITMAEISKLLGQEWKDMSMEERQPFIDQAKQIRVEHMTKYPDYKYQPRRKKNVGGMTGRVKNAGNITQNNVIPNNPVVGQIASSLSVAPQTPIVSNGGISAPVSTSEQLASNPYPTTLIYQTSAGQQMVARIPQTQMQLQIQSPNESQQLMQQQPIQPQQLQIQTTLPQQIQPQQQQPQQSQPQAQQQLQQQQEQQSQLGAASVQNQPVVVTSAGQTGYVILQSGPNGLYLQPISQLQNQPQQPQQPIMQHILASPQSGTLAQPPMQTSPQLQAAVQTIPPPIQAVPANSSIPATHLMATGGLLVSGDTLQPMTVTEGQVPFLQM